MNYLEIIKDLFQGLGSIGVLVVVFAFWKMGFFDKKNGKNGTSQESINQNFRTDIKELFNHAGVANSEMSEIKIAIAIIKTDIKNIDDNIREIKEEIKK